MPAAERSCLSRGEDAGGQSSVPVHALSSDTEPVCCMQVRGYEAQVRQLEAAVQHRAHAGSRAQLLGQRVELVGQSSSSQRACLLQSTQKLDKSSDRIKQSRQTVADMEVRLYVPFTTELTFSGV